MYNSNTYISIPIFGLCRDANSNVNFGLGIAVFVDGVNAQLIVKGNVNINSNGDGMFSFLEANTKLEINVENGSTLESCGNTQFDIYGTVDATATATFPGTGYTCDQAKVVFIGDNGGTVGTVDGPVCQPCS